MENKNIDVGDLDLDLDNFRTSHQASEAASLHSMQLVSPNRFWGLMESLLDSGFLPTENVIVQKTADVPPRLVVREGNRRVGALKFVHGKLAAPAMSPPSHILDKIKHVDDAWRTTNSAIPCLVFDAGEDAVVDRIVQLVHGKGADASRDPWTSVAKARHNRDKNHVSEPGLDLLEKFLLSDKGLKPDLRDTWAGDFKLTVLDEATKKLAPRCGFASAREFADAYPAVPHLDAVNKIISDIGLQTLRFEEIRKGNPDFMTVRGLPIPGATNPSSTTGASNAAGGGGSRPGASGSGGTEQAAKAGNATGAGRSKGQKATPEKTAAVSIKTAASVKKALSAFTPVGPNRDKLVMLVKEAQKLNLGKTPHAFCFVLRSMFEISAKAYCADHSKTSGGPQAKKTSGEDRSLVDVLRDIVTHLTESGKNKAMQKQLHGAMTDLAKHESILSVTSMNQLIHNPSFSIAQPDLCTEFGNIFPLLEAMNT